VAAFAADSTVVPQSNTNSIGKGQGPRIVFSEVVYDFGKVDSGTLVKHVYTFTNTGNQVLEVREVKPSCGCTTAGDWDKRIEPGKSGSIPVQFNSTGYGGQVQKSVTVSCNDPAQPDLMLQLRGNLWKPIDFTPAFAMFTPGPDIQTNETRVVKIINNVEEPLKLSDPQCTNSAFKVELETVRQGKEFELHVTALAPFPSDHLWTAVVLKTSSTKTPVITINCYVNVQPALVVIPAQFTLPPGPLTNSPKFTLIVRNNSTNAVSLSDPAINISGAEIHLTEIQPGRMFNVAASFPQGFKCQAGQPMMASLKSSNPKYPVLNIPVIQISPRSTPPQAAAGVGTSSLAAAPATTITAAGQNVSPVKSPAAVGSH
jgi:hypothetical protein